MGAKASTLFFQPMLLGTAIALIIVALIYKNKAKDCSFVDSDNIRKNVGLEIFKTNMGLAVAIIIGAVLINFVSGFGM